MTDLPPPEDAEPDGPASDGGEAVPDTPRRRSRWLVIGVPVALGVIVVAAVAGVVYANRSPSSSSTPTSANLNYGVARRTTVNQTQSLSGTIAYTASQTITNHLAATTSTSSNATAGASSSSSGSGSAVLTTMAPVGATIKLGSPLYTINELPVTAMYGAVPAYRDMQSGDTGSDVTQLQKSLTTMGYNPGSTDGTYGAGTVAAVEAWQKAAGLTVDGIVHLGQVVFIDGPSRVIAQLATIGEAVTSGTQVLSLGPQSPIVTTSESSTQLGLLTEGQTVEVQLPDNSVVPGKVTSVGGAAASSSSSSTASSSGSGGSGSGTGSASTTSSTAATVVLDNPALGTSIAGSSVSVIVTTGTAKNVMAVPLGALLATSSGEFVVQAPDATGALSSVVVHPSIYDDTRGIVAVPGANLTPGQRVVVAAS